MNKELHNKFKNLIDEYKSGNTHCDNNTDIICEKCDWNYESGDYDDFCIYGMIEGWVIQHNE